jgi:protein involved in polysaccharide export with SLBB domain
VFRVVFIYLEKTQGIYISVYIPVLTDGYMPLTRKTRISGSSVVVTIPSQLAEAYDISTGDELEIIPLAHGELKLRKTQKPRLSGGGA